jgi:hypothetical protein
MSNYNQITDAGSAWTRPVRMSIENPMDPNQQKYIRYFEENVATISDKVLHEPKGYLDVYYNPTEEIVIRNMITGTPTPVRVPHQYLYQILYSLYRNKAEARDQP